MWVKALNGNVFEVPDILAPGLVVQGHSTFATEAGARGKSEARKPPVKRK